MNRNILQCLLWLLLPTVTFAQQPDSRTRTERRAEQRERINKLVKQEEEGALIYQKQNIFGVRLYSDGYSAFFEKGFLKTPTRTTLFSLELGERKHPKEDKVSNNGLFAVNSYIYGKINNFYFAKLGIGQSLLIGGKGNRNGVAVSAVGKGGLSVGLLKPYYLDVLASVGGQNIERQINYVEGDTANNNLFLDPRRIQRSSGLLKGFGEMSIRPGLFGQAGLRFDYGRYNETVTAIEAGLNAEFYPSKVPQMVLQKQRNLFVNLYVTIEFGKRK